MQKDYNRGDGPAWVSDNTIGYKKFGINEYTPQFEHLKLVSV
jgi:hypothetical protein